MRYKVGEILAAPSGGRVSVRLDEGTVLVPILRAYSPTTGDQCLVGVDGHAAYVLGALGTAPPPPKDPAEAKASTSPPPDDPVKGAKSFKPVFTGTYRGGWRGDTRDLYQGDWTGRGNNTGAAYFGKGPSGLGGTCTRFEIRFKRGGGGSYAAVAPTFKLLDEKSRPGGAPTIEGSDVGPALKIGDVRTYRLPDAWGQAFMSGASGGIGIASGASPYLSLVGGSISVRIEWRK